MPVSTLSPAQAQAWPTMLAILGPLLPTPRTVEPGTLLEDLGLDLLDRDVIALELGDATGLDIPDDDARKWLTIADILETARATKEAAHV